MADGTRLDDLFDSSRAQVAELRESLAAKDKAVTSICRRYMLHDWTIY